MNSFAGVIGFPDTDTTDIDWIQSLNERFPSHFHNAIIYKENHALLAGKCFTTATDEHATLWLDGEIFNGEEITAMLRQPATNFTDNATLILALILEKGLESIAGINGQFLIVYKNAAGVFHLLNDHSGIQQVCYHQSGYRFIFASEIKFLLAHQVSPKEIDWESALLRPTPVHVLSGHVNYRTWFKEMNLLPEASICTIDPANKTIAFYKYWDGLNMTRPNPDDTRTATQIMDEYMALLEDAVNIRVQDNGAAHSLLSGGLDSSAICALAVKYKPVNSYSIITQTTCLEDTTSVCYELSKELGIENAQFLIPYHEINFNKTLWKQRLWRAESPINHTDSLTKTLLQYAINKKDPGIKYVLSGTGSDQYNGGLARYIVTDEATQQQSAASLMKAVEDAESRKLIGRDDEGLWQLRGFINRDYLAAVSGNTVEENTWLYYVKSALHIQAYSLLWDEIRAASANGHSVRFPFLDYRFAAFIAAIPAKFHQELFYDKQILRVPAQKILPDYVLNKPKAPPYRPEYDSRFKLFDQLCSGDDSLLIEAFGDEAIPHPVINKKQLYARVDALKQKPELMEWLDIMHLINLGLLEKMHLANEADMAYESTVAPQEISFEDAPATRAFLEKRLSIKTKEDILQLPIAFAEGCSLLEDRRTGTLYLSKNNNLTYELDEAYTDWRKFLFAIDGVQSAKQLLTTYNMPFENIEEFLAMAIQEQILIMVPQLQPA